ncbi:ADP-ribosylglycohydrolase family protein [Paenibacillus tarimensis]
MVSGILNEHDYYRTVYGGWLGKNIGGTLGAPVEGRKELLDLSYYPVKPDGPLENDDLDLQLACLHAMEQYGPGLTARELGQEWLEHIFFPYDEYGYALTNLRRGLIPPVAGSFNNPFIHCMGSPIRSEFWAMIAPGSPGTAAYYAHQDAIVDHAGGEGVYGEMLFAALESAIFFEKDRDRLIEIGMKHIPGDCRTSLALKDLIRWHKQGKDWKETRQLILDHHGNDNFTDAPQNIAFTILGWLYGKNFEDAILISVNCGYDTDCTAATLGAILGMLLGPKGLPDKWVQPVGDRVVVSPPIKGFPAPKDLEELTRRTIRMGKEVLAYWNTGIIVHSDLPTSWNRPDHLVEVNRELWNSEVTVNRYLLPQGSKRCPDAELVIDFGEEGPAIGKGRRKILHVTLSNRSQVSLSGTLALELPEGWEGPGEMNVSLSPSESVRWDAEIRAASVVKASYELALRWMRSHDRSAWAAQLIPFTIVNAKRWKVAGPDGDAEKEVFFPGDRLDWEKALDTKKDGLYRAKSTLYIPTERTIRLIAASDSPVTLKLNGQVVISCQERIQFLPAYHRAPKEQWIELHLSAGIHQVEVEAIKNGNSLQVYILTTATGSTSTPGPYYFYTDVLWGK